MLWHKIHWRRTSFSVTVFALVAFYPDNLSVFRGDFQRVQVQNVFPLKDQGLDGYDASALTEPWSRAFCFNSTTIVSVLLRPIAVENHLKHAKNRICQLGSSLNGQIVQVRRSRETFGHSWDAIIVYCRFERPIDQQISEVSRWKYSSIYFPANDMRARLVYHQRPENSFNLTVCVPSVHGTVRFQWIKEWLLVYKEYVGVEHTFLYSHLSDLRLRLIKVGINMRWTPFSILDMSAQNAYGIDQHYWGQPTTIYDCLFLNRYLQTKWTIFQDLDEVMWLPPKWQSLSHLLSSVETGYDAVSFGKWNATIRFCRPRSVQFSTFLDRMNVFMSLPRCGELCPSWYGGRKYVAQSNRVEHLCIHYPDFEKEKGRALLDLKLSEGFMRHYQTVANLDIRPYKPACSQISHRRTLRTASMPFKEFNNSRPLKGIPF